MSNWNVIPFARGGDGRPMDFDLYVNLLVAHFGFTPRDAEVEARKEVWRNNWSIVRSCQPAARAVAEKQGAE